MARRRNDVSSCKYRSLVDFQKSLLNKCMQQNEKAVLGNNGRLLSIDLSGSLELYIAVSIQPG